MSTPAPHSEEKETYQFACPKCWTVRTVTLVPGIDRPMCDCGSPLFAIGEVESEDAEYLPLDHPHTEPNCSFCAVRQTPMQHRLWCAIYFLRNCNCGYGQQPLAIGGASHTTAGGIRRGEESRQTGRQGAALSEPSDWMTKLTRNSTRDLCIRMSNGRDVTGKKAED